MKISYNWLKQFIKIDLKSEETATLLTDLGLEVEVVEKYQSVRGGLEGVVVGRQRHETLFCYRSQEATWNWQVQSVSLCACSSLSA